MKAAIIGAGLIGRSWALVFARGGAEVDLWDQSQDQTMQALASIAQSLRDMSKAGLVTEPAKIMDRISGAGALEAALDGATHVQESIVEQPEPKQALFTEIEKHASPDAVLTSSTSAIMPSVIFSGLKTRERCLVAHPMNPPHLAPIVELCGADFTSPQALEKTSDVMSSCGMAPIMVRREIEGFILNRLQHTLLNESFRLIANGYVSAADLDKTITEGLALRWSFMGPIETIDLNAPQGVGDYMARYGEMIRRVGQPAEGAADWPADIGSALDAERREALPREQLASAQAWRDRRLMALAIHKREAEAKIKR